MCIQQLTRLKVYIVLLKNQKKLFIFQTVLSQVVRFLSTSVNVSFQGSLTRNMSHATISRDSPKKRDANDAYDFNDSDESPPVPPKKSRIQGTFE